MTLTIKDGRDKFYTFDTNRILLLTDDADSITSSVHLETDGDTSWDQPVMTDEDTLSKYVEIPQEFLEGDYSRLVAYFYCKDEDGNYTYTKQIFRITYRQEPEGYYISYTNRATWDSIKEYVDKWASDTKADKEEADASAQRAKESETNAKTSETNVAQMEANVENMKASVEATKTLVDTVKEEAETIQGDIRSMKASVEATKTLVDTAKEGADSARDTAQAYAQDTQSREANVTAMKASVEATKAEVQALKSTIETLSAQTVTETIVVNGTKVYKKGVAIKNGRPYCTLTEVTE